MGLFSFLGKGKQDADDDVEVPVRPRRRGSKAQDEEPIDPMLPEKKRARRRLIGASALVLAAVIGLPMIFSISVLVMRALVSARFRMISTRDRGFSNSFQSLSN